MPVIFWSGFNSCGDACDSVGKSGISGLHAVVGRCLLDAFDTYTGTSDIFVSSSSFVRKFSSCLDGGSSMLIGVSACLESSSCSVST